MNSYQNLSMSEQKAEYGAVRARFEAFKSRGLKLNIARGVPSKEQLDLSQRVLTDLTAPEDYFADGVDTRSYGLSDGLPCAKAFFAELASAPAENVIVGGNSSLNMMYDAVMRTMLFGIGGCEPLVKQGRLKWICVVPGYDRHFAICEQMGIEMVTVPMLADGPDMDAVEELVRDPQVKGIWCTPKYSNPDGTTYSDAVVRRMAGLKPAARDFRVYWDNAYCIHDVYGEGDRLAPIYPLAVEQGNPDLVLQFMSTSKISFPGAGVAALAASDRNIQIIKNRLKYQTIGYDKLNQYRHVKFYKDVDGLKNYMRLHRNILGPKFKIVLYEFEHKLGGYNIARWSTPKGGYFINLDVLPGTAKRVWELCRDAGVTLTQAGATYPYGVDPEDKNLRIAPSYPPVDELLTATKLLCLCVKIAAVEKLLEDDKEEE
jgi:aspartate/methionine/tyrosine aminotransferase